MRTLKTKSRRRPLSSKNKKPYEFHIDLGFVDNGDCYDVPDEFLDELNCYYHRGEISFERNADGDVVALLYLTHIRLHPPDDEYSYDFDMWEDDDGGYSQTIGIEDIFDSEIFYERVPDDIANALIYIHIDGFNEESLNKKGKASKKKRFSLRRK